MFSFNSYSDRLLNVFVVGHVELFYIISSVLPCGGFKSVLLYYDVIFVIRLKLYHKLVSRVLMYYGVQ